MLILKKMQILKENKGKSGVYRWVNKETGKSYVGSGTNLARRFYNYYSAALLIRHDCMVINRALLKYGYSNFTLEIIEYCEPSNAIAREQFYLDLLKPEYNILVKAGSSLGFKHAEETKTKMSLSAKERLKREGIAGPFVGKCHTESSLALLSNAAKNRLTLPVPGLQVEVTNIETNITIRYDSIRKAADALDSDIKTLLRREKNKVIKPYRGIYKINIMRG